MKDTDAVEAITKFRGRVPSLDGLRAISIIMVVWSHSITSCGFPAGGPSWLTWLVNGGLGVRVFFVISGFIITLLLLKEEQNEGSFSIGRFYVRRIFRILPVYYLFLLTVIVIDRIVDVQLTSREILHAFTFTTGWWKGTTWMYGHTWSLAVEEQFYLLWPAMLLLVKEQRSRIILVIACIAVYPALRILVYISALSENRGYLFITQGDAILFGCLLAILLFYKGAAITPYFKNREMLMRLLCLFLIGLSNAIQSKAVLGIITVPFSNTIESLSIVWLIGSFIFVKDGMYRFLNSSTMVFIGMVSYSWYLWQQVFLFDCERYFSGIAFRFPVNIIVSFGVAIVSYYLVERNFERLKRKLMMSPTRDRSDN